MEDTPFPEREESELAYRLSEAYRELFEAALAYIRDSVNAQGEERYQRVRWWSALALLRSLASSPRAAAATLDGGGRRRFAIGLAGSGRLLRGP